MNADPLLVAPHPEESPLNGYRVERKDRRETLSLLARSDGAPNGTKTFITPCFLQAIKVIPVSFCPCAVLDQFASFLSLYSRLYTPPCE